MYNPQYQHFRRRSSNGFLKVVVFLIVIVSVFAYFFLYNNEVRKGVLDIAGETHRDKVLQMWLLGRMYAAKIKHRVGLAPSPAITDKASCDAKMSQAYDDLLKVCPDATPADTALFEENVAKCSVAVRTDEEKKNALKMANIAYEAFQCAKEYKECAPSSDPQNNLCGAEALVKMFQP